MTTRERLQHLAEMLENWEETKKATKVDKFDIRHWYRYALEDCGTVACAGGMAARHPLFQAEGLTLSHYNAPKYGERGPNASLEKFFGLSEAEEVYIFHSYSYKAINITLKAINITPRMVAKHIREVLSGKLSCVPSRHRRAD
jgi:hypothetical protein